MSVDQLAHRWRGLYRPYGQPSALGGLLGLMGRWLPRHLPAAVGHYEPTPEWLVGQRMVGRRLFPHTNIIPRLSNADAWFPVWEKP